MIAENETKNIKFLHMVFILKNMKKQGVITSKEYARAKKYYRKMTGADIIVND